MSILSGQPNQLKKVPKSNKLSATISKFPGMMKEVVCFP